MKPLKHKIGFWLLLSLIPAGALLFISAIVGALILGNAPSAEPTNVLGAICMLWIFLALPPGLVLLIWGNIEFNQAFRRAQRYAELNGWQPISRVAWRNRKQGGITLAVDQSAINRTFILTIQAAERIVVDEFYSAVWGMSFGDWLWQELANTRTVPSRAVVVQKREEWEDMGKASPELRV